MTDSKEKQTESPEPNNTPHKLEGILWRAAYEVQDFKSMVRESIRNPRQLISKDSKEKLKNIPRNKQFRSVHFTPLLLAIFLLMIPSILGKDRLDYLTSDRFVYPIAYFLSNTLIHWLLAVIFIMIWLVILFSKTRRYVLLTMIFTPLCLCISFLSLMLYMYNMSALEVDTIEVNLQTYYLAEIDSFGTNKPYEHHLVVYTCDSLKIICETVFWDEYRYKHDNIRLNQQDNLLLVYNQPVYGRDDETIAIINLDKLSND
jgi:hypothetical protein